jgi:competence protein ComEC
MARNTPRRTHEIACGFASRGIDPGQEAVSPYLWSRGLQKLDVVALTHAHQDHLGGLLAILENFRVGQLWIGREVNSSALAKLEQLARDKNICFVPCLPVGIDGL